MNTEFYFKEFYPFQDQILALLNTLDADFYLSGGTAASRGYLGILHFELSIPGEGNS